jgi:Flp pilus assembly pilin Flp
MNPLCRERFRQNLVGDDEGQTMAEYGVVLSVITVATVLVFTALSGSVLGVVNRAATLIPG